MLWAGEAAVCDHAIVGHAATARGRVFFILRFTTSPQFRFLALARHHFELLWNEDLNGVELILGVLVRLIEAM